MEWRLGQTEDLKVRRWPPKGLGESEWGANSIAHTAHLEVTPVAAGQCAAMHLQVAPVAAPWVWALARGGVRPHIHPRGKHTDQPNPSNTS